MEKIDIKEIKKDLEKFVKEEKKSKNKFVVLEEVVEIIEDMKNANLTYAQMVKFLNKHKIKVSVSTLRGFFKEKGWSKNIKKSDKKNTK